MKYLIYLLSIILLLGLNLGIFSGLALRSAAPNLLLLAVIIFAAEKHTNDFFFVAFFSGLFMDIFSGSFIGSFTLAFVSLSLIIHLLVSNVVAYDVNWKYLTALVLGGLLYVSLFVWLYGWLAFKAGWTGLQVDLAIFNTKFITRFLYNLLLVFPVYFYVESTKKIVEKYFSRARVM